MGSIVHDTPALEVWSGVLAKARSELPDTTIVMWFSDVQPVRLADEILTLSVPSPLVRERLQHHHLGIIEDAAEQLLGHPVKIEFEVTEGAAIHWVTRRSR
jgi:chromosomal replication initiator protein